MAVNRSTDFFTWGRTIIAHKLGNSRCQLGWKGTAPTDNAEILVCEPCDAWFIVQWNDGPPHGEVSPNDPLYLYIMDGLRTLDGRAKLLATLTSQAERGLYEGERAFDPHFWHGPRTTAWSRILEDD